MSNPRAKFRKVSGVLLCTTLLASSLSLFAQTESGWINLIDGSTITGLNYLGEANWRAEDGAVVVDHHSDAGAAFLITPDSYEDFQVYLEFWASDDLNSGIFIRCAHLESGPSSTGCYEVNIFDQRPDPSYGTGGVVNFSEVDPMPKAGGRWNTMEVTAQGRQITVKVNGTETANFRNALFGAGPIALQYGAGVMKVRKYSIRPL